MCTMGNETLWTGGLDGSDLVVEKRGNYYPFCRFLEMELAGNEVEGKGWRLGLG